MSDTQKDVAVRKLALSIARCDEISISCEDEKHPCHKIVRSQNNLGSEFRQVPEAWAGNLTSARILFVSSNPSISTPKVQGTGEDYPLAGFNDVSILNPLWPDTRLVDFQINRLDQNRETPYVNQAAQFLCQDGLYRGSDQRNGTKTAQKFWKAAFNEAAGLLGDSFDLSVDLCMTEVVHCKSKKEIGVRKAAEKCSEKYFSRILELSGARVVLVGGSKARDRILENYETWEKEDNFIWQIDPNFGHFRGSKWRARDHVGLVVTNNYQKVVVATQQLSYASNRYRFIENVLGVEATSRFRGLLTAVQGPVFSNRDEVLEYLGL